MDSNLSAELQQRLDELQAIFHAQLPGKIDEMRHSLEALQKNCSSEQLTRLHRMSHSLAGSAGTFGAREVGQAARNLEQRLKTLTHTGNKLDTDTKQQLQSLLNSLIATTAQWNPQQSPSIDHDDEERQPAEMNTKTMSNEPAK